MDEPGRDESIASRGPRALLVAAVTLAVVGVVALGLGVRRGGDGGRFVQTAAPPQVTAPGREPLPAPARELSPGDAAPALVLPDLDGVMRDLARYRGQPVVLNVWASWCPPCIREMPSLQRLHERAAGRFAVVTVSVDDDRRAARALVAKAGLSVPVLLDAGGRRLAAWGTVKYPETWVLDAEGRVVDRVIGEKDWAAPPVVAFLEGL